MWPESVLKKFWGYSSFRLLQKEIVEAILSGKDTLALLPTGGGKSVCYQVPGLLLPGATIVISPLISLMKDQVDALLKRNISATYLASSLTEGEQDNRMSAIKKNKYKFIYVSPEKLSSNNFINLARSIDISLAVVDESHCISLWGEDFRPSYLEIPSFINKLSSRPILAALTATATPATKQEIVAKLQLNTPIIFQSSFKRDISIAIVRTDSLSEHELQLIAYLKNNKNPGIIYTSSRRETERVARRINQLRALLNINRVGYYHAGMSSEERLNNQEMFIKNEIQLLVATTAFGMGIDKPDISFVLHYHPPATLEGYFQEIGRAGRDGQHASTVLLFNPRHLEIHHSLLAKSNDKHKQMLQDVINFINTPICYMQQLLRYFGEKCEKCGECTVCLPQYSPLEKIIRESNCHFPALQQWSNHVAQQSNLAPEMILSGTQQAYFSILEPRTISDLALIPGIGRGWLQLWAPQFLSQEWYNTQASIN